MQVSCSLTAAATVTILSECLTVWLTVCVYIVMGESWSCRHLFMLLRECLTVSYVRYECCCQQLQPKPVKDIGRISSSSNRASSLSVIIAPTQSYSCEWGVCWHGDRKLRIVDFRCNVRAHYWGENRDSTHILSDMHGPSYYRPIVHSLYAVETRASERAGRFQLRDVKIKASWTKTYWMNLRVFWNVFTRYR